MPMIAKKEPFTLRDLENFPEDGKIREVIGGELYVTGPPGTRHQRLVAELMGLIWSNLRDHPEGTVLPAPLEVVFTDQDVVQPDIVFVRAAKSEIIEEKRIVGAPDWLIEVLSSSTRERDLETKRKLYSSYGVVYWAVDLDAKEILSWDEAGFEKFTAGEAAVSVLPTFRVDVERLFSVVD